MAIIRTRMGSSFGKCLTISTWGESHGPGVGVVIDGIPSGWQLDLDAVQAQLARRRPGQSSLVTQRQEPDTLEVLSGLEGNTVLGTSLALLVRNTDQRSRDYEAMAEKYRPSHADFTYEEKYGVRSSSGGGRASARETVGRVAAGAIAEQWLFQTFGVEIVGFVSQVHDIATDRDFGTVTRAEVDETPVRCPDLSIAAQMVERIEGIRKQGDSVGGIVTAIARGVPAGWGEPVFDKLEADLAKALLSLPACKGFESGLGFRSVGLRGSEHNDPFRMVEGKVVTTQNNSGGIQGGISNGMPITMRAAFKPTATIMQEQLTVNTRRENDTIAGRGRHDPCVLPRAVPMVEAMIALVLADHAIRQRGRLTNS